MSRLSKYARYCGVFIFVWLLNLLAGRVVRLVSSGRELSFGIFRIGDYSNAHGLFGAVNVLVAIILSLIIFVFIYFLFLRSDDESEKLAWTLIFSGGLLNFLERVRFGYVHDIFAIGDLGYFNFADLVIGVGIMYLVIRIIVKK
jgi:lipoprotein signal peptidase